MNKKNLEDLILIQNKYKLIINQLKNLNKQYEFLKKCLISMSKNLLYLNYKNFYSNQDIGYEILLNELELNNKKLNKIPSPITFKVLKNHSLLDLSYKYVKLICLY